MRNQEIDLVTNPEIGSHAVLVEQFLEWDVAVGDEVIWCQCSVVEDGEAQDDRVAHLVGEALVPDRIGSLQLGGRTLYASLVDIHLNIRIEYRLVLPKFALFVGRTQSHRLADLDLDRARKHHDAANDNIVNRQQ